jgi:hypothetical protein
MVHLKSEKLVCDQPKGKRRHGHQQCLKKIWGLCGEGKNHIMSCIPQMKQQYQQYTHTSFWFLILITATSVTGFISLELVALVLVEATGHHRFLWVRWFSKYIQSQKHLFQISEMYYFLWVYSQIETHECSWDISSGKFVWCTKTDIETILQFCQDSMKSVGSGVNFMMGSIQYVPSNLYEIK